MTLNHAAGAGRHPLVERGADLYETPPCAVEALLRIERLPHCIWEPAAGRGAIVQVMRDHGHAVIASDITDYGFALDFVTDFLTTTAMPAGCEAILTNPPYQIADQFTRHALGLAPRVYLLPRLAFLESVGRTDVLEQRGLCAVHVFRNRIPMMHRDGWAGPRASSAMPFAWFVWDRDHRGPPTIRRISTQPNQKGDRAMSKESKTAKLAAADEADEKDIENTATTENSATAGAKLSIEEELDAEEQEFRALRRDLPGVKGASAVGIVAISVGKAPTKNEFFRSHREFRPIMRIVDLEVGMERQFFAVTPDMVEPLAGIGITVSDHTLYLTITSRGAVRTVPVRCANADGDQNEYVRTKEVGLLQALDEWVRLYADLENRCYKVFPAPAGRFAEPQWPDLKPAKIVRLAFRDKGRLIDSTEHPLFKKWAARDSD
jgi:hypothetical protein